MIKDTSMNFKGNENMTVSVPDCKSKWGYHTWSAGELVLVRGNASATLWGENRGLCEDWTDDGLSEGTRSSLSPRGRDWKAATVRRWDKTRWWSRSNTCLKDLMEKRDMHGGEGSARPRHTRGRRPIILVFSQWFGKISKSQTAALSIAPIPQRACLSKQKLKNKIS